MTTLRSKMLSIGGDVDVVRPDLDRTTITLHLQTYAGLRNPSLKSASPVRGSRELKLIAAQPMQGTDKATPE